MPTYTHTIPTDPPRQRVDAYALRVFAALPSRKQARKMIKAERLLINDKPCNSAWFVRPGDTMTLTLSDAPRLKVLELKVAVRYEDPYLAVVDKPAGLHVRGNFVRTLHRALRHNLTLSSAPDALPDPDPVHRLDYRTQGLVLIARTATARARLGQMFERRQIHKRYRALVLGRLEGSGEVDAPIDGRPARSQWRAVAHTRSLRTDWLTTVDLFPVTGRTHQLRRHMTGLGHPILGDDLYHNGQIYRHNGLFLCAVAQRFDHPITQEAVHVERSEPDKFSSHRKREDRRWRRWHHGEA
ncbi:MAG: RluA family pseudouridine synthase [Myxococcota bacterium]